MTGWRRRGWSTSSPQSGSKVALIKISDARENMFLRRALEVETVRTVAKTASAALIDQLTSNLHYQQAAINTGDLKGFHTLRPRLSRSVAGPSSGSSGCGPPPRRRGWTRPGEAAAEYTAARRTDAGGTQEDRGAIQKRDGDAAAAAMNDHLEAVLRSWKASPVAIRNSLQISTHREARRHEEAQFQGRLRDRR